MIDKETVKHVAKLARLNLTDEEVNKFSKELSEVLENFSLLKEVETDGVEPSFQPVEIKNVVREDEREECLSNKDALANAEQKEGGFIKGPRSV